MAPREDTGTGIPRWVKVSALAAGIVVLVGVVAMLMLGGDEDGHSPGRHASGDAQAPAALDGAPVDRRGPPAGESG